MSLEAVKPASAFSAWERSIAVRYLRESKAPRLAYAIPIAIGVLCTLWRR